MGEMQIKKLVLGPVMTNCYIVYEKEKKEALIIDPADRPQIIEKTLEDLQLAPAAILLTHGHFDHILGGEALKERYGILVYAHQEEVSLAADEIQNEAVGFGTHGRIRVDRPLSDGQILSLGGFQIRVIHTPGHTAGGVCYYFEEQKILFSGDTLFAGSVGRTDLHTGNYAQIISSVREKLFALPEDVRVFPGHDEETTIGYEMKYNPFIV